MAILNSFHRNGMLYEKYFYASHVMYDTVKTKVTIKIKKDFCTVFPMSGLSHVWCGGKIAGRSGQGVMVK